MDTKRDTHGSDAEEWVGFDLDGTLAKYDGWKGIDHIGEPVQSMVVIAKLLNFIGKKIKILTARVAPRDGENDSEKAKTYVEAWCKKNLGFAPEVTYVKDASMVALFDDRAIAVEQNTGKVLGGWGDLLPKASGRAKDAVKRMASEGSEKKASERPSNESLWRMYDIIQADARLSGKIMGLGYGRNGDAYRKAAIRLGIKELATVLKDGKRIRNRIVHATGYVPSESDAGRAIRQYADAERELSSRMQSKGVAWPKE